MTASTALGLWLWVDDREYLVPFADYPVLKQATVEKLLDVKRISRIQCYW